MARISQTRIRQFLHRSDNAQTTTERGRALEDLICYLFEKLPGIALTARDVLNTFDTEEIDVAFWNDRHPRGLYFLPDINSRRMQELEPFGPQFRSKLVRYQTEKSRLTLRSARSRQGVNRGYQGSNSSA